ncbi:MAG TPA: PIN domain nuclease [bacterium]|nr:PIN domain nuclease [bacterium]
MILVDTSVWIDYFAGRDTPYAREIERLVNDREDVCICGIVLTEILRGIRKEKEYQRTRSVLLDLIFLPMTQETFYMAADIYRTCRSRGITIRNATDCMIAAACLQHGARLLHNDRDFDSIGSLFGLRIAPIST